MTDTTFDSSQSMPIVPFTEMSRATNEMAAHHKRRAEYAEKMAREAEEQLRRCDQQWKQHAEREQRQRQNH